MAFESSSRACKTVRSFTASSTKNYALESSRPSLVASIEESSKVLHPRVHKPSSWDARRSRFLSVKKTHMSRCSIPRAFTHAQPPRRRSPHKIGRMPSIVAGHIVGCWHLHLDIQTSLGLHDRADDA